MPFKHNAARRDKFAKVNYRVTNWAEYNKALRQRGDVTVWISEDAVRGWYAPRSGKRGGQRRYSDLAIETCLILRVVFGLPLRQTQGFVRSLLRLIDLAVPVPDFSTLCRRAQSLQATPCDRPTSGPMPLIVDSTGLRVHGGRGWMQEKHGLPKTRRTWRKLHIGLDPESGEIVASCLTTEHVGDPGALPYLLAEVVSPVRRFIGDGAYDGAPTAATIREALGPDVELIIPPPKNAVPGEGPSRNAHIDMIAAHGRIAWQKATGYGQRSRGEAQIGRYKAVIGPKLRDRRMETQTTETQIAVKALNRMTRLGRAVYERAA
ncbi:IS5 family transposase [Paracoccus marinaquae]|uniref:IS5 family transposase n=1 Tax=Paracoccus marinaquae TaxID=2841926 RepID=A0ABS6APE1_9RHOB|nr:IS5 family transposase [Paracoccus marinaquae]MBU3032465.1 IS5 family transposase [Paracoccus marinaquae]